MFLPEPLSPSGPLINDPAEQQIEYTEWQEFDRVFTNGETETRWMREIVYGHRQAIRYFQITTDV